MPEYRHFKVSRYSFCRSKQNTQWFHVVGISNLTLTFVLLSPTVADSIILTKGTRVLESIKLFDLYDSRVILMFRRPKVQFQWSDFKGSIRKFCVHTENEFDNIKELSSSIVNFFVDHTRLNLVSSPSNIGVWSAGSECSVDEPKVVPFEILPPILQSTLEPVATFTVKSYARCETPIKLAPHIQPVLHWQHLAATSGLQLSLISKPRRIMVYRQTIVVDDIRADDVHLKICCSPTHLSLKYRNNDTLKICRRQLGFTSTEMAGICAFFRSHQMEFSIAAINLQTESTRITSHISSPWSGGL
ncbi:hypothetical protein B9G98_01155 [Wickerhamiella sorbophila]|uniref:Uncharacterized protein n=1 Tax=Wickerhamiella sorbophila TaxID=45607 RepID=A0A2T0FEY2_9ASCO|nr:hypothetical protein B9G98_01155 [Wickerhamiella sorbophila]PRT53535.1 hypothetical protein B9G98_01155 [Wickerhamiella sorbophila]